MFDLTEHIEYVSTWGGVGGWGGWEGWAIEIES